MLPPRTAHLFPSRLRRTHHPYRRRQFGPAALNHRTSRGSRPRKAPAPRTPRTLRPARTTTRASPAYESAPDPDPETELLHR
ncbi:hypothetical protein SLNWT_3985 [Streptomyces albus]|uniref:Uncharacterized protein n=1 Tax=Streptomyces albus (strain ATCC 21838 / DSM 41398 / FERM P-419 / JCM 4703 / NBRC 107858) TaxID=1081613 RepID=A0A0B5F0I8_STRA4|nr:hypothetical protein SLNWT_3985 [Streptomyces albus]AOU78669.1 hypothetical protein SLNHY_3978 [Streptomyces albus]